MAQEFPRWIDAEPGWEIMTAHPFSLVCFRVAPPAEKLNSSNPKIRDAVNATQGEAFLFPTKLHGQPVSQLAVENVRTECEHFERARRPLQQATGCIAN